MRTEGLTGRLKTCADLIGTTATLADIGTDHAYLAIHLLASGKISRALLTDINEGPLLRAKRNVESAGLTSRCEFYLTDGAAALSESGATAYSVCGMGGETVADILSRAPHLKDGNITLVLQPMSRPEALRAYLFGAGFEIEREAHASDSGKHYVAMRARYTGKVRQASAAEVYFGSLDALTLTPEARAYLEGRRASLIRARDGITASGGDASFENELIAYLTAYLDA